jgi:hypothetical protein
MSIPCVLVGDLLLGILIGYLVVERLDVRKGLALLTLVFIAVAVSLNIPVAIDIIFEGLVIISFFIICTG